MPQWRTLAIPDAPELSALVRYFICIGLFSGSVRLGAF
jgi:hypothetical protein